MREHRLLMLAVLSLACYGLAFGQEEAKKGEPKVVKNVAPQMKKKLLELPDAKPAIMKAIDSFGLAFNEHDAKKVAASWAADAVYTDRDSGEKIQGREDIEAAYGSVFDHRPEIKIGIAVHALRMVTPEVAQVEATVTVSDRNAGVEEADGPDTIATDFSAILKLVKGAWLLDSGVETELPKPVTAHDHLQSLDWLVGEWHDAGDDESDLKVRNIFRWSSKKTFLIRSFHVEEAGEVVREGTQVIGWDPEAEQIRSWVFGSEGAFGEGFWTEDETGWTANLSGTLPDGSRAVLTQILRRTGENTMTSEITGQEINGELQPSKPVVKMVRVVAEEGNSE